MQSVGNGSINFFVIDITFCLEKCVRIEIGLERVFLNCFPMDDKRYIHCATTNVEFGCTLLLLFNIFWSVFDHFRSQSGLSKNGYFSFFWPNFGHFYLDFTILSQIELVSSILCSGCDLLPIAILVSSYTTIVVYFLHFLATLPPYRRTPSVWWKIEIYSIEHSSCAYRHSLYRCTLKNLTENVIDNLRNFRPRTTEIT